MLVEIVRIEVPDASGKSGQEIFRVVTSGENSQEPSEHLRRAISAATSEIQELFEESLKCETAKCERLHPEPLRVVIRG